MKEKVAGVKPRGKSKPLLEFIEEIKQKRIEKKEIEELMTRVIILRSEDVLREMRVKEKNKLK